MTDDHSEERLSTTTLAREFDTTEYVVRRMIHLGELTAYRMGRVIRIRREDADATIGRARPV
jgi:excisionase family DNA binding protein